MVYRKEVAFINKQNELAYLKVELGIGVGGTGVGRGTGRGTVELMELGSDHGTGVGPR